MVSEQSSYIKRTPVGVTAWGLLVPLSPVDLPAGAGHKMQSLGFRIFVFPAGRDMGEPPKFHQLSLGWWL